MAQLENGALLSQRTGVQLLSSHLKSLLLIFKSTLLAGWSGPHLSSRHQESRRITVS